MMIVLLQVRKMDIKSNKKNPIIKNLFTKKFKPKIVKAKKGKGSYDRKKTKQSYQDQPTSTLKLITILSSSELFFETL